MNQKEQETLTMNEKVVFQGEKDKPICAPQVFEDMVLCIKTFAILFGEQKT